MQKITIINPQDGVKWKAHLEFLKREMPGALKILMTTESLIDYLDSFVAHVVAYRAGYISHGLSKADAEKQIMMQILPDEVRRISGRFTQEDQKRLDALILSLESRTVELEV